MIICLDHFIIRKTFVPTSPLDPKMDVLNLASLLTTGTTIASSCMSNHRLKVVSQPRCRPMLHAPTDNVKERLQVDSVDLRVQCEVVIFAE